MTRRKHLTMDRHACVPAHLLQHPYRPSAAFQRRTLRPLFSLLPPFKTFFFGSQQPNARNSSKAVAKQLGSVAKRLADEDVAMSVHAPAVLCPLDAALLHFRPLHCERCTRLSAEGSPHNAARVSPWPLGTGTCGERDVPAAPCTGGDVPER